MVPTFTGLKESQWGANKISKETDHLQIAVNVLMETGCCGQ